MNHPKTDNDPRPVTQGMRFENNEVNNYIIKFTSKNMYTKAVRTTLLKNYQCAKSTLACKE